MPIYEQLIGELLTDPVLVSRELDELLIKWWARWQQPAPRSGSTRST